MRPRLVRRWRQARTLRAGDYIHDPCSSCRVRAIRRRRDGDLLGVECVLDSGTVMGLRLLAGRDLDVTRTLRGWRRFLPA